MRWIAVASALFIASIANISAAENASKTAQQWLSDMAGALHTLSYEGIFVYVSGPRMESLRLRHVVDEQGERERIISLNGAPREIMRHGQAVTSILPDARAVFNHPTESSPTFPSVLGDAFTSLAQFYNFQLIGTDRIAERESQLILVQPRDDYRYGYRLWLDSESAIPLRVDLLDEGGYPLEQVMFTSFSLIEDTVEAAPEKTANGAVSRLAMPPNEIGNTVAPAPWRIESLPDGFKLFSHIKELLPGSSQPVDHVVFSDGLVSVSAYMELMPNRRGLNGLSRMGAFNAFGIQLEDYQVTVVGEVPAKTVEHIGRAIVLGTSSR